MNILRIMLEQGGIGTYMIFLSAIVLVIVGTERLLTLYQKLAKNTLSEVEMIRRQVLNRSYMEAIQVCNTRSDAPDMSVIKSALLAVENGREAMRSALGASLLEVTHKCEERIQYLALIANVATLLGLFGTISGLIRTFRALGDTDAAEKAKLLGLGISEAMYSTAAGLAVGIAGMVIHTICVSKSDSIVGHAQDLGFKVISWVEQAERQQQTKV